MACTKQEKRAKLILENEFGGKAMARVKFQDRLQRSFLGYAALIVAVIVALFLGGFLLNAYTVVIRGCRQGSREATVYAR